MDLADRVVVLKQGEIEQVGTPEGFDERPARPFDFHAPTPACHPRRMEPSLKQGLPAVAGPETRILILGSLPGDASLARRQYYGHPRNLFWRLMGEVLGEPLQALDYEARLLRLAARGVGLWDVVARARRPGSLDAALRDVDANDLEAFVAGLRQLRAVAFNGGAAARIGGAALAAAAGRHAFIPLPSSSPAYAGMSFVAKAERWAALRPFVLSSHNSY